MFLREILTKQDIFRIEAGLMKDDTEFEKHRYLLGKKILEGSDSYLQTLEGTSVGKSK